MKTNDSEKTLCELPDSEFELGGTFDAVCREAGYASGKSAANDLNLWNSTVSEAVEVVKGGANE